MVPALILRAMRWATLKFRVHTLACGTSRGPSYKVRALCRKPFGLLSRDLRSLMARNAILSKCLDRPPWVRPLSARLRTSVGPA
jgi:hypothetical protein